MASQGFEMNNHWRIPEDQGNYAEISKRDLEVVRRWKIATALVFILAIVGFGLAVVALTQVAKTPPGNSPLAAEGKPRTSAQMMTFNQSDLDQSDVIKEMQKKMADFNRKVAGQRDDVTKQIGALNTSLRGHDVIIGKVQSDLMTSGRKLRNFNSSLGILRRNLTETNRAASENNAQDATNNTRLLALLTSQGEKVERLEASLTAVNQRLTSANATLSKLSQLTSLLNLTNTELQGRISLVANNQSRIKIDVKSKLDEYNQSMESSYTKFEADVENLEAALTNATLQTRKDAQSLEARVAKNEDDLKKLNQDIGWIPLFNGFEYFVRRSGASYNDSRKFCQKRGADLATTGLQSNESRRHITENLVAAKTRFSFWIGLNDFAKEGEWRWLDGRRATSKNTNFHPNEPNNFKGDQDCGYMHKFPAGYQMADYRCAALFSALCERPIKY